MLTKITNFRMLYAFLFTLVLGAGTVQAAENISYDFRDGTIITKGASDDGLLTLSGQYSHHSENYGLNMKVDGEINITVSSSCTINFLGSNYSSVSVTGTAETEGDLGTMDAKVTTDLSDSFEFTYTGAGTTLNFKVIAGSGGDLYLPLITITPIAGPVAYDFRDGTIITKGASDDGLLTLSGQYSHHSENYGLNMKVDGEINITVSSSCTINFLGSNYSSVSVTGTAETEGDLGTMDAQVTTDLSDSFEFTYTGAGTTLNFKVIAGSGGDLYLPLITITPIAGPVAYDFRDGTIITKGASDDGLLTLSGKYNHHSENYGLNLKIDGEINITVSGSSSIRFLGSKYSSVYVVGTAAETGDLGTMDAKVTTDLEDSFEFKYIGSGTSLNFKAVGASGNDLYLPLITITPIEAFESNGKIDVWDFAATELNTETYNNHLTETIINSWYDETVTAGSKDNVLPSFSANRLSWTGGKNDRLRTTNTNITRYDENISNGDTEYTGRIYVNASAATSRFLSLILEEDDEVTLITKTDVTGTINFEYVVDPAYQTDQYSIENEVTEVTFVAKQEGTYHIYDSQGKPSYFRIYRKEADYVSLTGSVDITAAEGIPADYMINFTNDAGKMWSTNVTDGSYSIDLPIGYNYSLSLSNANAYVINSTVTIATTAETTNFDVSIKKVELYTVTGSITGLGDAISMASLVYTPDPSQNKIFTPSAIIDAENGSYSVELEPNCEYTISAEGVNDYQIPANTITVTADQTADVVFEAKPTYKVTIDAPVLTAEQLAKLQFTFTNVDESGYVYSFESVDNIMLRSGVYSFTYTGLDEYTIELALTSNLKVEDAATTKALTFLPVKMWTFDDKVISTNDTAYKGMMLTAAKNEIAKGHLVCDNGSSFQIPVNPGDIVTISYYYSATFTVGDSTVTTSSGSTSIIESFEYTYDGTEAGYITVTNGDTKSYFTSISIGDNVEYSATVTVGEDKDYQTINAALAAIRKMNRPNDERVRVMIDPGNYEEMLDIDINNVTFVNAATTPDIALLNKGVDISGNAVRITSYYGHGYNYYSMSDDQKWHEDVLAVNKENGFHTYENAGSGTKNNSYWNATVIVYANGFEAENIIFENSFNQYISKKESEDVVVEWETGGKGTRPTDYGNTDVQYRSYVERAAALAYADNADKSILNNCRIVGRQDAYYGGSGVRVAFYKGAVMGAVDYVFGAMNITFYQTDFAMNTSALSSDQAYLTAAYQDAGQRGYLMYECNITSAQPGTETASETTSKPGFLGRPWKAETSEVVFYNTTIETSGFPGYEGQSLINPSGWKNSLGGESPFMYEYGTTELSGTDNSASRATWSTVLTAPTLTDGTEITLLNFTKGNDGWDPFASLMEAASSDATLSSLSIAEGTLSPEFDPSITSYTIEVPEGTTQLTIDAMATDGMATVETGSFATIPGSDIIKVTAEDGTVVEYTINVSIPVGIDENTLASATAYPIPTKDKLTISFTSKGGKAVIEVVSASNTKVTAKTVDAINGNNKVTVDLSACATGIYFVKLTSPEGCKTFSAKVE